MSGSFLLTFPLKEVVTEGGGLNPHTKPREEVSSTQAREKSRSPRITPLHITSVGQSKQTTAQSLLHVALSNYPQFPAGLLPVGCGTLDNTYEQNTKGSVDHTGNK